MTTLVKGKSTAEAARLAEAFAEMMLADELDEETNALPKRLKVFEGVKNFPARVKCAMLIWRTLEASLAKYQTVATETGNELHHKQEPTTKGTLP